MKLEGITVGTYTNRKLKTNLKFPIKKVCKKCKSIFECNNKKEVKSLIKCPKCKSDLDYLNTNDYYTSKVSKAILNLGKDLNNKPVKKTFTGKTEEEALRKLYAYKDNLEKTEGPIILNRITNFTLSDIIRHLKDEALKMGKISKNTYKTNIASLKRLQNHKLAFKPVNKVSRMDILNYFESIRDYSASTIKKQFEIVAQAFTYAYYQKLINQNFFEGYNKIGMPSSNVVTEPITALTIEEEKTLIEYLVKTPYSMCKHKFLLLLLISTGMRIGEALAISTDDVDIENGKLSIKRTLTKDVDNTTIIGTTAKTYSGKRTLNLNTMSRKALNGAFKHIIKNKSNLIFCKDDKTLYEEGSINSALKRICVKCNIRVKNYLNKSGKETVTSEVHTHMLRHTFATRCVEAKIAPAVLQKLMGHTDIATTMKYYVNVDDHFEISEYKNVESYLEKNDLFLLINEIS